MPFKTSNRIIAVVSAFAILAITIVGLAIPDSRTILLVLLGLVSLSSLPLLALIWRNPLQKTEQAASPDSELQRLKEINAQQFSLITETQQYQEELSGEVVNAIQSAVAISTSSRSSKERIEAFHGDFMALTSAISAINARIENLNQSVLTTSSATEQTAAAVEEITASIQRISEESQRRYGDIKDLVNLANSGQKEMEATRTVIDQVTSGIDDLRGFITIIEDIAARTSLLLFYCRIHGCHGGVGGNGFGGGGDEVRKLAESSTENAARITKRLCGQIYSLGATRASSQRTLQLLATPERKVKVASDSFLEIQQGTQELDIGGKEILSATESLREDSIIMKETMDVVRSATSELSTRVNHLESASDQVLADTSSVHDAATQVNHNSMAIAQSSIAQLKLTERLAARAEGREDNDQFISVPILILQHTAWISRVRAVLDGNLNLKSVDIQDHHACHLGQWFDREGQSGIPDPEKRRQFDRVHEELHKLARQIVLFKEQGKIEEAEQAFPRLGEVSEEMTKLIGSLAGKLGGGAKRNIIMQWDTKFLTGHAMIDSQHKELVRLINALYEGLMLGRGKAVTGEILQRLVEYTQTHFKDEERLFTSTAYPHTAIHLQEHQAFVAKVGELMGDLQSGKAVLGTDTLSFLKTWLTKHILGTDQGYASFIK